MPIFFKRYKPFILILICCSGFCKNGNDCGYFHAQPSYINPNSGDYEKKEENGEKNNILLEMEKNASEKVNFIYYFFEKTIKMQILYT